MTKKKKTPLVATKSKIAVRKPPAKSLPVNTIPAKTSPAKKTAAIVEAPSAFEVQLKNYEQAIQLFSQRKLAEARALFLEVAKGPAPHISDKARSYAQVCERRTTGPQVKLSTAEDHFNYGVERLNARDVELAKFHLGRALSLQPDADHVLFTLALCCGLAGDGNGACENLKRAIDLEPRNRILARQDPEFAALASQFPGLRALLTAEPSGNY
jgi:tetratricopeptide (TPR) repeat protein